MSARVLVVDDIKLNVKVLEAKLTAEYFDVIAAYSGQEALALASQHKPDIILLDVMMPVMDGYEVCRQLKSEPVTSHIPIVMVTALSDVEDKVRGLSAGADDFLTKPIEDAQLFARIRSLVRIKQMQDELRLRDQTMTALGLSSDLVSEEHPRYFLLEDNDREGKRLAEIIGSQGVCDVETDAQKAQSRILEGDYDAVLVSLGLKSEDGLRFCSHLRSLEKTRHLPIMLIASADDKPRIVKGLEIGITDYVTRPVDRNELLARARTQMRRKRYQDRLRQSYQQSIELAITDPLTGLYNRRYMATHLDNLLAKARTQQPVTLLMLDLDYFKNLNDTHGHAVGDEVLKEIGKRLVRQLRGMDLVCRFGGEEFILILPDTDLKGCKFVVERLLSNMRDEPFATSAGPITVTCSIGVAISNEHESTSDLLKRADMALYMAKGAGRNRASFAGQNLED